MNPARASAGHSEISPTLDPADAWAVYEPTSEEPWDLGRVAHLHRRAGFEADWVTLQRDLADGPEAAVDRLLEGEPDALDGQPAADFERFADAMAARVATGGEVGPLRAAWCYRLLLTPHPLRERLTLFWHDHFATSAAKVGKPSLMANQNALLRRYALGSFPDLLRAVARDPAMLTFLDSASNRKAHPNENYAREVMELFTLGRGAYDERDVQEAARAFTGSFLRGDHYRFEPAQHDEGIKDVLGVSGNLDGDSVAAILLDRPACSTFLARKLFALLVDELDPPQDDLIGPVAAAYRDSGYVTRVPVELILRSRLFYSASCRRRRVKSPIEFAVGSVRAFEVTEPTVSATELASACDRMGQTLLAPPSVAGWDGGRGLDQHHGKSRSHQLCPGDRRSRRRRSRRSARSRRPRRPSRRGFR